jgi:phosphatidylglycerophosphate synthase
MDAGSFLPVVPHFPFNFGFFLAYFFFNRCETYDLWIIYLMGFLTFVNVVFDQLAGSLAKKFGADKV